MLSEEVIYFSGEETLGQISDRARRLGLNDFRILSTDSLEAIISTIKKTRPKLAVIDSIQTLRSQDGGGSTEQIRNFTMELVQCAKQTCCALIVVGHVTKTGGLAGPKLLEHMVDVVLAFEGNEGIRTLRSTKNRFGSTDEIALFTMTPGGLQTVADPSAYLCHFRSEPTIGSIIFPSREGSRPMLVEIQALVAKSHLQLPRRSVVGWCPNRAAMLLAIMENHAKIKLYDRDVYINVVGGVRITDTANADLAVAIAILSSVTNTPIPVDMAAFGEVTLSGDVRPTYQSQERINICQRHRINQVVCADSAAGVSKISNVTKVFEKYCDR
jgi:DNA repair protein RadA/Sms